jgi:hypothetical protein
VRQPQELDALGDYCIRIRKSDRSSCTVLNMFTCGITRSNLGAWDLTVYAIKLLYSCTSLRAYGLFTDRTYPSASLLT